jgi:hypothetical protein
VYHSCDNAFPLLDFAYKQLEGGNCVYTLVNATVGQTHDAAEQKINEALNILRLGDAKVRLVYTVPGEVFAKFMTNPVNPSTRWCPVFVACIPKPSEEAGRANSP